MSLGRLFVLTAYAASLLLSVSTTARAQSQQRILRIVAPWEITGLDPVRSGYIFTRLQIAETLTGADDGGLPQPQLAGSWTSSDNRLAWRFVLRPNARFHDGSPVTADAVAKALQRAWTAAGGVLVNSPVAAIEVDGKDVIIRTTKPFVSLTAFLAHSSTMVLAPSAYEGETVKTIVGSGPYRAVDVQPPLRVEAARFDQWDGPAPRIERVTYLAVGRGETRTAMAESGQAELVVNLPPESVDRLRRNSRIEVQVLAIPRTRTIKVNAGGPFFSDSRVRQALSLGIDRNGIATALLRNPGAAATQIFPPTLAEWHVPGLAPLAYDPTRAKALLAEAGWRPGPGGVLVKDGRSFSITLRTFSDRPEQPVMATAMQEQLRGLGIEMKVAIVNSGEIPAGHQDGTLDLALMARNFSLVPDPIGTLLQDFGPKGGDWGAMGWSNAELIAALDGLGGVTDPRERASLRARVATILQSELPVIPVAWYDHGVAANKRIRGVTTDPLELSYRISAMSWAD